MRTVEKYGSWYVLKQRRSDITGTFDLLMTFQAKLLFVFAVASIVFLLVSAAL